MNKLFNDKRLKYGTYSTVVALVVIGIFIAINLVVGQFDYKFDLTTTDMFSLSEESKAVLDDVNEEVTIYTLFQTNNNDSIVKRADEVIKQYQQYNRNINIVNKDLYLYPDFASQYSSEAGVVSTNDMIVVKGNKYKIISYNDYLYHDSFLNVESLVTSAVQYVNMSVDPKIYYITGHGESDYTGLTSLTEQLGTANYKIENLNLLDSDIPSDCTMLMLTPSFRDYSAEEAQKVSDYLANDGRAIFALSDITATTHPNLFGIITNYGVELSDRYVLEGNEANYMLYNFALAPNMQSHSINNLLIERGYRVLSYGSQAISELELKRQGLVIEPLLTTTDKSFMKAEGNESNQQEAGDISGPFNVAVAITDSTYTDTSHTTKVIILGSYLMLDPSTDELVNYANSSFVLNAINWLNDEESSIYIAPKSLSGESIIMDASQTTFINILSCGILPAVLFIIGFIVWLKRRNK